MLYLVSSPIGNMKDITLRAIEVLSKVEAIVCEDKREVVKLLREYKIPQKPLIPFYEEVENQKTEDVLALAQNFDVALISDAGTPLISDPGYKLVREAIRRGIKIESLPGPCAAVSALTLSGLPPDKFLFLGYPPEKQSHAIKLLESLKSLTFNSTIIFYVSPHKLLKFLKLLNPDQQVVVCRELTKIYEEVWRGSSAEALNKFHDPKGEFVLLFNNPNA